MASRGKNHSVKKVYLVSFFYILFAIIWYHIGVGFFKNVLKTELGNDWRTKFSSFEMKPFAAASIGQVHCGTLLDGFEVAIKIQYPGVAKGIESDIDNLMSVLKIWNVFPQGELVPETKHTLKQYICIYIYIFLFFII